MAWAMDTYMNTVGQIYKSTTNVFLVTTAGTSAASAPSFVTTSVGSATTDGTAVVKFLGTTAAFTVATHYLLSAEAARVGIIAGANLALACDLYTEVTGDYLSLNVDYTPAAESRDRMVTSGGGSITGPNSAVPVLPAICSSEQSSRAARLAPSVTERRMPWCTTWK